MNRTIVFLSILFLYTSCNHSNIKTQSHIQREQLKTIKIPLQYDNIIQSDSLFDSVKIVRLETKEECLLANPQKVVIFENKKIFIQDFNKCLLLFDINGKFISKIGNNGRGPGEYLQLAGFDIDSIGNIYLLDYHKILKYNPNGIFQSSTPLNLSSKRFQCWPEQIIVDKNGYYVWSGSTAIKENHNNQYYAMYKITKDCKIIESFFPIKHKIMNGFYRFRKYRERYNIDPTFGNDTIYSISRDGVTAKYYLDFGKRSLHKKEIPHEFSSFSKFKSDLAPNYSFGAYRFTETDDWIYFQFSHNFKYYNSFYSKKTNKTFVSIVEPDNSSVHKKFIKWIDSSWGNDLIVLVDPSNIIAKLDDMKIDSNKEFSYIEADIKTKVENIKITDNPVLFICKMKKY